MTHPIWKGYITFGLVSIPVTLFTAINESNAGPSFHFIDRKNNKRVKNLRVNEETGEEVPWADIVKGYEYEKDKYVIMSDEDFEKAAVEANQIINIEEFVELGDINTLFYHKPYYLVSEKKDEKGYVLLREILKKTHKAGIAKVVISKRQYLSVIMPVGNALALDLLLFKNEIKELSEFEFPGEPPSKYKITESEMNIAGKLIEMMSGAWQPEKYNDEYSEKLFELIDKKIKQPDAVIKAPKAVAFARYSDFMEILQKSVKQREMSGKNVKNHKKIA